MRYIFELYKGSLRLAEQEVLSLLSAKKHSLEQNLLIVDSKGAEIEKTKKRFAYTKAIYQLLFSCKIAQLDKKMKSFAWENVYRGSFSIRINDISNKNSPHSERDLAKYVWRSLKKPKVDLKKAKTPLVFLFAGNIVFGTLLIYTQNEPFEERRSHLRPRPTPISLHPKLARAMVNLSGATTKDTIVDPFVGSGGILIEAGLMGIEAVGFDISKKMILKSRINLRHYGIKPKELVVKDYFLIKKRYPYIVADPPYGLNANIMEKTRVDKKNRAKSIPIVEEFYKKVIAQLERILSKRAVIMFPGYVNYEKIIKKSDLKITGEFDQFIHQNLTRKIVVLEKRS